MSTTSKPPAEIRTSPVWAALRGLRRQVRWWFVIDGVARLLAAAVVIAAVDLWIDWTFILDRAQRMVMLALAAAALLYVAFRYLLRPLFSRLSDDALCLLVEKHYPQLGQSLISAVQLAREPAAARQGVSPSMVQATIRLGLKAAEQVDFFQVLRAGRYRFNQAILVVATLAILGIGASVFASQTMSIWFDRNLLLAERPWPQDFTLTFPQVADNRLRIPRGEDWPLVVRAEARRSLPAEVYLEIEAAGINRSENFIKQEDGTTFEKTLPQVNEAFRFRAYSGRVFTDWVDVEPVDRPEVRELELIYHPPAYTGEPSQPLPRGRGPYALLPGSTLMLRGTASKPLSAATLGVRGDVVDLAIEDGTFSGSLKFAAESAGTYSIALVDQESITLPGQEKPGPLRSKVPTRFTLRAKPDREPQITARLSGISGMIVPQARIPYSGKMKDDYAITATRVRWHWATDDAEQHADGEFPLQTAAAGDARSRTFDQVFDLQELALPVGAGFSFHIEADDNNDVSGPGTGKSTSFMFRVVSEEELRADLLRREKQQRQEIERQLTRQVGLLADTQGLSADTKGNRELSPEQQRDLARVQKEQKSVGLAVAAVAERMSDLLAEAVNNQLAAQSGPLHERLQDRVILPLERLAKQTIPAAVTELGKARRHVNEPVPRDQALAAAMKLQQEIEGELEAILKSMIRAEDFQFVLSLLHQIERLQRDVYERALEEEEERVRRFLEEGKDPAGNRQP